MFVLGERGSWRAKSDCEKQTVFRATTKEGCVPQLNPLAPSRQQQQCEEHGHTWRTLNGGEPSSEGSTNRRKLWLIIVPKNAMGVVLDVPQHFVCQLSRIGEWRPGHLSCLVQMNECEKSNRGCVSVRVCPCSCVCEREHMWMRSACLFDSSNLYSPGVCSTTHNFW